MNHDDPRIRPVFTDLAKRAKPITLAEYREMRMNSYEREVIIPNLDDEALAYAVESCFKNLGRMQAVVPTTYEEAVAHSYAPELLKRLMAKRAQVEEEIAAYVLNLQKLTESITLQELADTIRNSAYVRARE